MAGYNRTRYVEELLEKTVSLPPSFTVHLHPEYWTLNNGSKFLYNNQIASLLDDIRAHRIPVDFLELFDSARVPFYDGCMIVELLDYRPQRNKEPTLEKPERTRAVLHPNSETLWADLCSLNQKYGGKWTDSYALDIEARLLLATAPPLCLDPDPHLTRIANHVLRVSTPTVPVSLKRKAVALDPEEDETDKARRAKIMQFMSPRQNRTHPPSYRILDTIQRVKQENEGRPPSPTPPSQLPIHQFMSAPQQPPPQQATPVQNFAQPPSPSESDDPAKKNLKAKKPQLPQPGVPSTGNGTQTPVPPQATHQFQAQIQNAQQTPSPASQHSPMQPHVYANAQPTNESAKRTPTPAQGRQRYSQSPQVPSSQPAPAPHPPPHPQAHPPSFAPTAPNPQFLHQPPQVARNGQPSAPANTPQQSAPQPGAPQSIPHPQAQLMYAHHFQHQQHLQQQANMASQQQRANQPQSHNGQPTSKAPPLSRSPMGPNQGAAAPVRGSPMVSSKPPTSRSPMPPNAQQINQMTHPPQHPQHLNFAPQYNPAHLRPVVGGNPSPIPPHVVNGGASAQGSTSPVPPTASSQDQAQVHQPPMAMQYPQMFSYQQMNFGMPPGGLPQGYWPVGVGRGMPGMANGQPTPGRPSNPQHPQQPPIGAGKAAGLPGR